MMKGFILALLKERIQELETRGLLQTHLPGLRDM